MVQLSPVVNWGVFFMPLPLRLSRVFGLAATGAAGAAAVWVPVAAGAAGLDPLAVGVLLLLMAEAMPMTATIATTPRHPIPAQPFALDFFGAAGADVS